MIRRPDLILALSALAFAAQPACAQAARTPAATPTPKVKWCQWRRPWKAIETV